MAHWIDSTLAVFSPKWALERARARQAFNEFRTYDAAMRGRRTDGWRSTKNSAKSELSPVIELVRNRARDLVRNNPYAASAVRKLTTDVVGTGIAPRFVGLAEDKKNELQSDWDSFVENCDIEGQHDLYALQAIATRAMFESGEVLIRWWPQESSENLRVPLRFSILEGDFLDHTKNQVGTAGAQIVNGVEYDKTGRRIAYWLFKEHPGDTIISTRKSFVSERVEAKYIDHIFETLRPGQARGVTMFAPVVMRLRDINDYNDAEIVRKKIEACFAAFVKQGGGQATPVSNALKKQDDGSKIEELRPGMISYLGMNEDVTFGQPTASAPTDFLMHQLYAVGAGIGVPYHKLTGDVSQANYSSLRASLVDYWALLDVWQWHVIINKLCRPAFRRFAQSRPGQLPKNLKTDWAVPARTWVDPLKDAEAEKQQIRMGRKSLRQSIAETGGDPDQVLSEVAATNKQLDQLGLILDSDPRQDMPPSPISPLAIEPPSAPATKKVKKNA
ncbi:MAG: phage portal protein [Alphaproteobacteria bacterium]